MIKRWTISVLTPDGYDIKPFDTLFNAPQEIVLAADHEAEIGRLQDNNEKLLLDNLELRNEIERLQIELKSWKISYEELLNKTSLENAWRKEYYQQ